MSTSSFSRRSLILGAPLALAACAAPTVRPTLVATNLRPTTLSIYDAIDTEPFPVPAIDTSEIDPELLRQTVDYDGPHAPGTIVVDADARFLYHVRDGGRATRYGVGVGREGFAWSGRARIGRKAEWPTWTPPVTMIKRRPDLKEYAGGMPGGIDNPLGARALYLYDGQRDTLFRLHGTNEPDSIGQAVSSGCIRLFNQDIIDLHRRVAIGTPVVVLQHS